MKIGSTIRAIRKRKGITIAQLCEGTGLSKGFMSHVENNKTSPSIATLDSIAQFLNVPLPYLLLHEEERLRIVRKDERKQTVLGKEQIRVEHLIDDAGLRLVMIELPVGAPENEEMMVHAGSEVHYVLKGKVLIRQGEDSAVLEEGDSFSWKACVPHLIKNAGEEPAVLLIANYSEERTDITL
ncbi:helix-turn-helix domain-containing protein [Brevibacillus fulvus]|uniref:Transcriptional regulator with XRE-family HTH domain n=1 Tax=Brevibacillus fulvus TaxID=1125967 RepID=A0A938XZS9_9BACL|nr:XRE family transcriptional regulator [Brevibacillus fulvus]MBM7591264.1 transcriptional regulator with XRE-family HTH domain [Brevibacillus fulvus]